MERADGQLPDLQRAAEAERVAGLLGHARRQIDQVSRRLLKGERIPHAEKVFSVFEEHTRWVSKGKAGCPVELGVPVCIVEDQHQFVLGWEIEWCGGDTDVAVPLVRACQQAYPELRSCSFDKGFHSPANRAALDRAAGTERAAAQGAAERQGQGAGGGGGVRAGAAAASGGGVGDPLHRAAGPGPRAHARQGRVRTDGGAGGDGDGGEPAPDRAAPAETGAQGAPARGLSAAGETASQVRNGLRGEVRRRAATAQFLCP